MDKIIPESLLKKLIGDNPYIAQLPWPKQIRFLELECMDALYGGAGAGGKSSALLTAALMFAQVPGYSALIVRRNFTDLKLPGGLIDRSIEWLSKNKGAKWNAQENRWRFREGSTLQFGYADKEGDERRYHGAEFQYVGIDEAVQFTDNQLKFFFERLRRKTDIPVPVRMRLATTPGGVSHDYLRKRYVEPSEPNPDRAFIPATMLDNPAIDAEGYMLSLSELDPLRRAQILNGDWNAVEGGRFKREWFGWWRTERDTMILSDFRGAELERFNPSSCARFQTCDPAASTSTAADYFVNSTWLLSPRANVVWWGCTRDKFQIQEQVTTCQHLYRSFHAQFLALEVVLNQRALWDHLTRSTNPPMVVRKVSPKGQDKLSRAAGFITLAASGRVFLPAPPCPDFPLAEVVDELVRFTGEPRKDAHDDVVDSGSYMTDVLPLVRPGNFGSGKAPQRYESKQTTFSGLR